MTTPALYILDDAGDLATYTGPLGIRAEDGAVIIYAPDGTEFEYPCADCGEAGALRDVIVNTITRAALAARPCCVVDMRDLDGAKAEAARRARVERDRAALGRR